MPPSRPVLVTGAAGQVGGVGRLLVETCVPGYGFSGKPRDAGWGPERIARTWAKLMQRLGHTRHVAQGGDWGSPVSSAMARQAPAGLLDIHTNLPATVPAESPRRSVTAGPPRRD